MDGQQRRRLTEEPVYPYETQSYLVAVLALPRSELEHRSRLMQERHVSYRYFPPIFVCKPNRIPNQKEQKKLACYSITAL